MKPQYITQGTIWLEAQTGRGGPIRQEALLATWGFVDLVKSFVVLDHAVRGLKLYLSYGTPEDSLVFGSFELSERFKTGDYELQIDDPGKFATLSTSEGIVVERVPIGDSIGRPLGFAWQPSPELLTPGRAIPFSVTPPRDAARDLGQRLQTRTDLWKGSAAGNFLRLELSGSSPSQTAATVNAVLDRYIDVTSHLKREKLTELAEILAEQLKRAETNLRNAEMALESFRVSTITLPSEQAPAVAPGLSITRGPVFDSYFTLRLEAEGLRDDAVAIERVLQDVPASALATDELAAIPSIQNSTILAGALDELTDKKASLRALQYRYTDDYPPLRELQGEIDRLQGSTIPQLAQVRLAEVRARMQELSRRIESASEQLTEIPPRSILEARLGRDVSIASTLYTVLQQRYEEARLAEASSIPDVRILDRAVTPLRPVSNRATQVILIGFAASLVLGVGAAILLDLLDRRLRYPEQVTSEMGLPILGAVPHVQTLRNGRNGGEASSVIEAIRSIKLSAVHAYGTAGPMLLTVTSPGSGDGKSFIASNLALAFADAGNRTLLIDGDARRGSLHRVLNLDRKPGLTDFLSGNVSREDVVLSTPYRSLHFIGCGTRIAGAPELLGSRTMSAFVTGLRSDDAVIIVDSPPLGVGVDAYVLGTMIGSMLLVLRTGVTDRGLAEAKLDVLDRLPVRILGAVLNGVRDGAGRYYQYYSYNIPGYELADEGGRKVLGSAG